MRTGVLGFLIAVPVLGACAGGATNTGNDDGYTVSMPMGVLGNGAAGTGAGTGSMVPMPGASGIGGGVAGTGAMMPPPNQSGASGTSGAAGVTGGGGMGGDVPGAAGVGGAAGMAMAGTGGMGEPAAGTDGGAGMGAGGAPAPGGKAPMIPARTAQCPQFRDGTISFMNLGGIQVVAGAKGSAPTAPMVFYWHGTGSTAGEYALMAGAVRQGVVQEGGVLISFQGSTGGDLLSGTAIFGRGDFDLADQLLACAVENHNVDPRRVFATGCSAGGLFSGAMAAARSSYMAAVAPNSGGWTVPVPFQNDWTPALMTVHGRAGVDVVIVDFATTSKTADDAFKARGGFVVNCDHGGGHCGGSGLAPSIWEFFKAHPYGAERPWSSLPAGFHQSCKIY